MSDNRRIIYTRPDGGVSIIVPTPGVSDAELFKAVPADAINPTATVAEDVPTDRTFRNAWKAAGRKCEVGVPKAKEIAHERRRAARAAEFAPLDVEATIPAKAAQAEAARQAIRDKYAGMQSAIDAATTVEELKAAAAGVL